MAAHEDACDPFDVEAAVSEIWEPWRPEIGQRVKIKRSGECPWHEQYPDDSAAVEGVTGVVSAIPPHREDLVEPARQRRHPYYVAFDSLVNEPNKRLAWLDGGVFAAIELEPIQ